MMSGRTGSHRSCLVGYVLLHCLCTIREGGRTLWEGSVMMSGRTGSHRSCLVGYVLLHCLCTIREAGPCGRVVL